MQTLLLFHRRPIKSFVLALLLLGLLLCPDANAEVCFSDEVGGAIVVELEKTANLKQQLVLQEQITVELTTQRDILTERVRIQKEQVILCDEVVKSQEQLAKVQDENCKQLVKAAAPSFWSRLGTHVTAFGVGAIIAAILVLIL